MTAVKGSVNINGAIGVGHQSGERLAWGGGRKRGPAVASGSEDTDVTCKKSEGSLALRRGKISPQAYRLQDSPLCVGEVERGGCVGSPLKEAGSEHAALN